MGNLRRKLHDGTVTAFTFLAVLFLSNCQEATLSTESSSLNNVQGHATVALLVPSSSERKGDDVLAQSIENAAAIAISEFKQRGIQIDLRIYDTAHNPEIAAQQAAQAVVDGAEIILGPVYSTTTQAASQAIAGRGVNLLSFSNNARIAGNNVYLLGATYQNTADRLVAYAESQGKMSIIIVYSNNVAGQSGRDAIESAIRQTQIQVAGTVPYDLSQQSVIQSIPVIKSIAESASVDAIFFTSTSAGAMPLYAQLLPEAGLVSPDIQFMGLARWDIPTQTLDLHGLQKGWFALPDPVHTQQFETQYRERYGQTPHPIGSLALDGITAIGTLISNNEFQPLSRRSLTQSNGFQGANGVFRFHHDGTNTKGLAIAEIQNKQVRVIDPAPTSFTNFGS